MALKKQEMAAMMLISIVSNDEAFIKIDCY